MLRKLFRPVPLTLYGLVILAGVAFADGRDLATKNITELPTLSGGSIASGDYVPVYDVSAGTMKKVDGATFGAILGGAYNGTVGATTPTTGAFTSVTDTLGIVGTLTPTADHATTKNGSKVAYTVPVHTTGTNIDNGYLVTPTISNATGGTNTFSGYKVDNVTGDAQVDVIGVNVGTGTRLGNSYGMAISSGWDMGLNVNNTAAADSAATDIGINIGLTNPVDTTGTNIHYGLNVDTTVANATGGTNTASAIHISNVTGDAQVNVTGLDIGTGTTLGTSNAIKIGSGWDAGIVTDSGVQINSTNGTAVTALRFAFDAVASGQTSKTTTLTGVTSSSRCVATSAEVATNAVYVRAAVPGTDQVVVTVSGDPGASNMDFTVLCLN